MGPARATAWRRCWPASGETLFANLDGIKENQAVVNTLVDALHSIWSDMAKDATIIRRETSPDGPVGQHPAEVPDELDGFCTKAAAGGLYDANGGRPAEGSFLSPNAERDVTRHRPLMSWRLSALIVFGAWKIAGRVPIRSAVPTFLAAIAALIPILVLVYGIGLTFKVFVVGIMAMPVIVRNTGPAVRKTPAARNAMATSFLARDRDVLLTIIPPAASPGIFPGLRRGDPVGP